MRKISFKMPYHVSGIPDSTNYMDYIPIDTMSKRDKRLFNQGLRFWFRCLFDENIWGFPHIEMDGIKTGNITSVVYGILNVEEPRDQWGNWTFQIYCPTHKRWHANAHGFGLGDNENIDECRRSPHCPGLNGGREYLIRDVTLFVLRHWIAVVREAERIADEEIKERKAAKAKWSRSPYLKKEIEREDDVVMNNDPLDFSTLILPRGICTFLNIQEGERRAKQYADENGLDFENKEEAAAAREIVWDAFDRRKNQILGEQYEAEEKAKIQCC